MTSTDIILMFSLLINMVFMIFVARYIYHENCLNGKKAWISYGIATIITETAAMLIPGEPGEIAMALIWVAVFSVMIALTRKKRRIRGLFLAFPIIGMVMSVFMIPTMFCILILGVEMSYMYETSVYELLIEFTALIVLLLYIKKAKNTKWIKTELGIGDRRILNANGILLLVLYYGAASIPEMGTLSQYGRYALAGIIIFSITTISSSIMMTVKSSFANYYKGMAEINEYYLKAQLDHFKAYQKTQRETRRIRHDMKNHMMCISDLYSSRKYEMLGEYIMELNNSIQSIDKELHIGNDIADAIINEKYAAAKDAGVKIYIEGSMSGVTGIEPIDVCKIFANALDNAFEAIKKCDMTDPTIEISVKKDKKFILISFTNTFNCEVDRKSFLTSKQDPNNHGFGLENIKIAAEKYKGSIQCNIVEGDEGKKEFCLEVMLMI